MLPAWAALMDVKLGEAVEITHLLSRMPIFRGLDVRERERLAQGTTQTMYAPGEFVFHQGDAVSHLHVVWRGVVKLFRSTAEGKEQTVYLVEEGEPFCVCALYGAGVMPLGAVAMNRSRILHFRGDVVEAVLRKSPEVLLNIVRVLNTRLTSSFQMIEDLALRTMLQRMASFLVHAVRIRGREVPRIVLSVPRREVAQILGTTPETVSRVLAKLEEEGLITARGREIGILDYPALVALAG